MASHDYLTRAEYTALDNSREEATEYWSDIEFSEQAHQKMKLYELVASDPTFKGVGLRLTILFVSKYLMNDRDHERCGLAWPGVELLSEDLNVSESTVQRAIKSLVDTGWWYRQERRGPKMTCIYWPNWQRVSSMTPFSADELEVSNLRERGVKLAV